jgi:hypothetical protein
MSLDHSNSISKQCNTSGDVDIMDLNLLISTLKKREENVIQLLDYTMKFANTKNEEERNQLDELKKEIDLLEKNR